jgi:outer membrane protein assembly factor BamB
MLKCWNCVAAILAVATGAGRFSASADDWPQWMGPGRDNVWRETGILKTFPESGPAVVWTTEVAGGYSGPAVAAGRVFITDYVTADNVKVDNFDRKEFSGVERVQCLDAATGKVLWTHSDNVKYSISYPAGPRCTPVVEDDRVYTLGAEGLLYCFQVSDGQVLWRRDLKADYGTTAPLWGYSAHPLIDGPRLLTLAGGTGSHVVALDKITGREIWRSLTSGAQGQGYSPPTIVEHGGRRQLILYRTDAVSAVNPETGSEYWSVPYDASNGSIIMSPVLLGDYLYVAGYSNRNLLLKLQPDQSQPEEVFRDVKDLISPVNVQPFLDQAVLYGFDQKGLLRALQLPEGKVLWETDKAVGGRPRGSETAFLVRHEDRFILFNEKGELVIAQLTPDGYEELSRSKVIEPSNFAFGREVVWSMPAFANRRIYLRNDKQIICLELAAQR